jgi:hypothetical protein
MESNKLNIHLGEEASKVELTVREGAAPRQLEIKPPVAIDISGVIGAPLEFLRKRVDAGQFEQKRSHLIVNRDAVSLRLVINEDDPYLSGNVVGVLSYHSKFVEFGINMGKVWTPIKLGQFFKMNRAFFTDKEENMNLVAKLMNFTATVNNSIERSAKESGDRTDNFSQVVHSNLPESFKLSIPIFKGMPAEELEVETFANVDGRDVEFVLMSPGANEVLETTRDRVIDEQLEMIKEVAPDIAIIEI